MALGADYRSWCGIMKKRRFLIFGAKRAALSLVEAHQDVDVIVREIFPGLDLPNAGGIRVAIHYVAEDGCHDDPEEWRYTEPDSHNHDEINIIIGQEGGLRYKYSMDDEFLLLDAPTMVYIPAGTVHRAEVVSGCGIFMCLTFARGDAR